MVCLKEQHCTNRAVNQILTMVITPEVEVQDMLHNLICETNQGQDQVVPNLRVGPERGGYS